MSLLIDHLRDDLGLPMRGVHHGYHVGWTTDPDKADAAREAGARVTYARGSDPAFDGWEVSCSQGREVGP